MLLLIGCAGPTKAGREARANAHNRMDVVNANLAAQQARQQFEVGQLDSAIETIDAAIARFETNSKYHLLRGRILLEQHRLDAAYNALTRSAELVPELAEPYYFLGVLHQRWSEDEAALSSYKKAMECNPTHPQYLLAAAESLVALNQPDEAIALLQNAGKEFKHHPSIPALLGHIYLRNRNAAEATKYLVDSRMLGNDDEQILSLLATAQFQSGKYADCLFTISQLHDKNGSLSFSFQRLQGKCLAATGRLVKGRDICLMVTRQTPDDAGAWIDLGYIAWEMRDYARVAMCGEKISQLAPEFQEGPLFEGIAAMHAGDINRGQKLLILAQSDNNIEGLDSLIDYYSKTAKRRVETPITLDMTSNSVEGWVEEHPAGHVEGSRPIVGVTQDSSNAP